MLGLFPQLKLHRSDFLVKAYAPLSHTVPERYSVLVST
jgi:hypothetical protein